MATLDTYRTNRTEFFLRAGYLPHATALKPESLRRMDEIAAAICAEHGIQSADIAYLPNIVSLGETSARLCRDWIEWLLQNDPDGDYEYL